MPDLDQTALAIVTGAAFGYFTTLMGSSPVRLAIMLVALWALQSLSQLLLRALEGRDVWHELVIVGTLRLAFGVAAVAAVWLVERWHKRKESP